MKRSVLLLLLLALTMFGLSVSAQSLKPCGTSVLTSHSSLLTPRNSLLTPRNSAPSPLRASALPNPRTPAPSNTRGLVILVSFPDQPFSDDHPRQLWQDIICRQGYDEHGTSGSVSDYFYDQSYGQFRIQFDVVGPVEVSQPYAYYGKNIHWDYFDDEFDQHDGQLVEEACRAVADSVSFSDYDWDDDGQVDMVYLLYAGYGESDYYWKDPDVIWPHMGTLSIDWFESYPEGLTLQGLTIDQYACSNELASNGSLSGHGTICHEFSHCLGLPDLYDTLTGRSVLGRYDLMDTGNYNGSGWCPPGYSSYERYACGWLEPEPTEAPHDIDSLAPLHLEPDVRIYREEPADNDYYLIEYRADDSWDHSLPSHGLMAWHIDYDAEAWEENLVNVQGHNRVTQGPLSIIPTAMLVPSAPEPVVAGWYDIQGRRLPSPMDAPGIYILRYTDGTTKKVFR